MLPEGIDLVDCKADTLGRKLINIKEDKKNLTVINVYFPTQDHEVEQLEFLEELKTDTSTFEGDFVIAGEFNMYLSNMDKDNENFKLSKASNANPQTKRYTWRRNNPVTQSMLDSWLVAAKT